MAGNGPIITNLRIDTSVPVITQMGTETLAGRTIVFTVAMLKYAQREKLMLQGDFRLLKRSTSYKRRSVALKVFRCSFFSRFKFLKYDWQLLKRTELN